MEEHSVVLAEKHVTMDANKIVFHEPLPSKLLEQDKLEKYEKSDEATNKSFSEEKLHNIETKSKLKKNEKMDLPNDQTKSNSNNFETLSHSSS